MKKTDGLPYRNEIRSTELFENRHWKLDLFGTMDCYNSMVQVSDVGDIRCRPFVLLLQQLEGPFETLLQQFRFPRMQHCRFGDVLREQIPQRTGILDQETICMKRLLGYLE